MSRRRSRIPHAILMAVCLTAACDSSNGLPSRNVLQPSPPVAETVDSSDPGTIQSSPLASHDRSFPLRDGTFAITTRNRGVVGVASGQVEAREQDASGFIVLTLRVTAGSGIWDRAIGKDAKGDGHGDFTRAGHSGIQLHGDFP